MSDANASNSARDRAIALADREGLNVLQLAQRLEGYSSMAFVCTADSIADEMQTWMEEKGSDGFNFNFPFLPAGLDDVVDKLIPELPQRGIFRREYEGMTLRAHLGLPRPEN